LKSANGRSIRPVWSLRMPEDTRADKTGCSMGVERPDRTHVRTGRETHRSGWNRWVSRRAQPTLRLSSSPAAPTAGHEPRFRMKAWLKTGFIVVRHCEPIGRANARSIERSNPSPLQKDKLDCFVARAPRNDGCEVLAQVSYLEHCSSDASRRMSAGLMVRDGAGEAPPHHECRYARTAFLRQPRCTAQVQPGGCEATSSGRISLAGTALTGASVGIAALARRSRAD
jgi:hypothetical protein